MAKTRAEIQRDYRERKKHRAENDGDLLDVLEEAGLLTLEQSCDPKEVARAIKQLAKQSLEWKRELDRLRSKV